MGSESEKIDIIVRDQNAKNENLRHHQNLMIQSHSQVTRIPSREAIRFPPWLIISCSLSHLRHALGKRGVVDHQIMAANAVLCRDKTPNRKTL